MQEYQAKGGSRKTVRTAPSTRDASQKGETQRSSLRNVFSMMHRGLARTAKRLAAALRRIAVIATVGR